MARELVVELGVNVAEFVAVVEVEAVVEVPRCVDRSTLVEASALLPLAWVAASVVVVFQVRWHCCP